VAGLAGDGNGLALQQSSTFGSALRVETRNNSLAAQQLGLTGGSYDTSSATLIGTDRAKVRVDCLFTHLLDLREGLIGNSVSGIQLASAGVESSLERIAEFRGVVGGNGQRVDAATDRETDRSQLDETIRSQLRDVDFTEAATRFSLLQTQLEAGLRTTAMASQRSLLDFLG
jgi:flagellin-like hook-associated protein FlgL